MPGITVFDQHAQEYDLWFDEHGSVYQSEVSALRRFIPPAGMGIEIGVGTGRFSIPFDIRIGAEPSRPMAQLAQRRGIAVCQAIGEQLPFRDGQFDFALLVTLICFVKNAPTLFEEVRRVLKIGRQIIVAFIDKNSALGQVYESHKTTDKFYRDARFYSASEVADLIRQAGFGSVRFCQTIFGLLSEDSATEQVRDGWGEGAFVVLSAEKH